MYFTRRFVIFVKQYKVKFSKIQNKANKNDGVVTIDIIIQSNVFLLSYLILMIAKYFRHLPFL